MGYAEELPEVSRVYLRCVDGEMTVRPACGPKPQPQGQAIPSIVKPNYFEIASVVPARCGPVRLTGGYRGSEGAGCFMN